MDNDELPYKKGVCWDRLIKNISKNKSIIEKVVEKEVENNYQIYEHHSKTNSDIGFDQFCQSETRI